MVVIVEGHRASMGSRAGSVRGGRDDPTVLTRLFVLPEDLRRVEMSPVDLITSPTEMLSAPAVYHSLEDAGALSVVANVYVTRRSTPVLSAWLLQKA